MFLLMDGFIYNKINYNNMVKWKFWKKNEEEPCKNLDCTVAKDQVGLFEHQISVVMAQNDLLKEELEYFRYVDIDKRSYE